ncbi:class I SAM-dependent methyltransferase [Edwardsiella piscicida]|nr:class I SAM-dependent methyltransferase [Edwardsiella piscicida]
MYPPRSGAGSGLRQRFSTARLQTYFSQVIGCDRDETLVAQARDNYPQLNFSVESAERYVPPQPVDLLTCATAFYWMDRPLMLSRMPQLLLPGGVFAPTATSFRWCTARCATWWSMSWRRAGRRFAIGVWWTMTIRWS